MASGVGGHSNQRASDIDKELIKDLQDGGLGPVCFKKDGKEAMRGL